ncbi:cytidylate kinase-like family protein [Georgenia yuyongxinii]|uniref:Cytidylate kinase-like family protein n=1 Tax=Georgenia yuyongxinii TaxID=2589797 RepID=A0A5B8C1K8_9MICO|nr:cytidylate kinase family protein [Georgenia yuyongxinii]QDC24424.1 cytidylate kinase-like family protein [Georgenia yuyongxinii]
MSESAAPMQSSRPGRSRPLIAISATYGAGGAVVGQRVADALGVPFLAHTFSSEQMEQAHREGGAANPSAAYLQHRVRGDLATDDDAARSALAELESRSFFEESDEEVRALLTTGGVVVGRAGPYLLRDDPAVLRVLLDGPRDARVAAGAAQEGVDAATAERRQAAHDASRVAVARVHYGVDPNELRHYAVVLDTVVLGFDTAADVIVTAARALHDRTASR